MIYDKGIFALAFLCISLCGTEYHFYPKDMIDRDSGLPAENKLVAAGHLKNQNVIWRTRNIADGEYYLCMEFVSDHFEVPRLYHNGVRVNFSKGTFYKKEKDGFHVTAKSHGKLRFRNGDILFFAPDTSKRIVRTSLFDKEGKGFTMPLDTDMDDLTREIIFSDSGSSLGEEFLFQLKDLTGQRKKMEVEIGIFDFYGKKVGGLSTKLRCNPNIMLKCSYSKGKSGRYRAEVNLTDEQGKKYRYFYTCEKDFADVFRKKMFLNRDWQFATVKDDGTLKTRVIQRRPPEGTPWQQISLATSWPNHIAWFKRELIIPEAFRGKRYFLEISRLAYEADIYVNNKKVYGHSFNQALAPFEFEITDALSSSGKNSIELCVRGKIAAYQTEHLTEKNYTSYPLTYDMASQGIGDVTLSVRPETYIGDIQIIPSVRNGTIEVKTEVPAGFSISNRILDKGKEVFRFGLKGSWKNPVLWGPEKFPLLQLVTELKNGNGEVVDVKNTRFGFREIWADGMNVLWNGHVMRMPARGFYYGWGKTSIIPQRRDYIRKEIREHFSQGVRMLRHVFGDSAYTEIADEEGMPLAMEMITPSHPKEENLTSDLYWKNIEDNNLAMIRKMYNHASIFTWGAANEFWGESENRQFQRLKTLSERMQAEDPTRFVECYSDLDLRGVLPTYSVHYPFSNALELPNIYYPDAAYWRPLDREFRKNDPFPDGMLKNLGGVYAQKAMRWGTKPVIVNEASWFHQFHAPHSMTRFAKDKPYESIIKAFEIYRSINKLFFQGYRDASTSVITPWFNYRTDHSDYSIPPVDIVPIQKYHSFYTGTDVAFDINLFHDIPRHEKLEFFWNLEKNGTVIKKESKTIDFDFCSAIKEKITFQLPEEGAYLLKIGLKGVKEVTLELYGYDRLPLPEGTVIGKNDKMDESLLKRVENGETILVLSRKDYPHWFPLPLTLTDRNASINYTFHPESPVLKGIREKELSYWYPEHKTGEKYFRKPVLGNFRSLVEAGGPEGLVYTGLLEVPYGKGRFILSRLNLDVERNPIAAKLVRNIFASRKPEKFHAAGVIAEKGSLLENALKNRHIFTEQASFDKLDSFHTLIVDGKRKFSESEMTALKAFSGWVFVHNPSAQFELGAEQKEVPVMYQGRALRVAYHPLLAGITNYDLFWKKAVPVNAWTAPIFTDKNLIMEQISDSVFLNEDALLCPSLILVRRNMILSKINWTTENEQVKQNAQRIISTLFTNLGVKIAPEKKREPFPSDILWFPFNISSVLDRDFKDDVGGDGKGGWCDQGPGSDLRVFDYPAGVHLFNGIPFRIERPKGCVTLKSDIVNPGGSEYFEIPLNENADAISILHSSAWTTSKHHYSIFINYSDRTQYEIKMIGEVNMRDWCSARPEGPFETEFDTYTRTALTLPHKTRGRVALYQTAWVNPEPGKKIVSVLFKRMPKSGVPILIGMSVGKRKSSTLSELSGEKRKLYDAMVEKAYLLQQQKKYAQAILLYEDALRMHPARLSVFRNIGACYEGEKNYLKAAETYQRSLDADYNQPDMLSLLKDAKKKGGIVP